MNSSKNRDVEELEEHALFSGQFKGKCRNCGQLGHKSFQCKIVQIRATMVGIMVTRLEVFSAPIVVSPAISSKTASN
jgi:Zinc knuckle